VAVCPDRERVKADLATPAESATAAPQAPSAIAVIAVEVAALTERIAKGEAWLHSHPGHVARRDTLSSTDGKSIHQPAAEDRWEALSPTGATIRALFGALNRAHAIGSSILAGDALMRRVEAAWTDGPAAPGDDESAAMVTQLTSLFDRWEGARQEVAIIEQGMGAT
jgi:hypothetical protein